MRALDETKQSRLCFFSAELSSLPIEADLSGQIRGPRARCVKDRFEIEPCFRQFEWVRLFQKFADPFSFRALAENRGRQNVRKIRHLDLTSGSPSYG